ncbi:MAG TPA: CRISPR-associated helicase Cas3' [Chloroflexi bacterium]|nr:CRISPR-associated helicase Cas3' [Chloroflexota bacterium]
MDPVRRLTLLWGKTDRQKPDPELYHPVLYHMLDTAQVAASLLGPGGSPRMAAVMARVFGQPLEIVCQWLPWAVAIHDIGKISADFQFSSPGQVKRITDAGFALSTRAGLYHALISQIALLDTGSLPQEMPRRMGMVLQEVAGGHHGRFSPPGTARSESRRLQRDEPPQWAVDRRAALWWLSEQLLPPGFSQWPDPPNISAAILALAGFTILCDWLGSNADFFPLAPKTELTEYLKDLPELGQAAITMAGFAQTVYSAAPADFSGLFSSNKPPRPLQLSIDSIPNRVLAEPCLAIIEAPTGEGKTEAALALAHRIGLQRRTDEFYFALPTTATSNAIYLRVQKHIHERLDLSAGTRLIHSQAFLLEDSLVTQETSNGPADSSQPASLEWFAPRKRALLAPFGVGTIDQAELGALNVSHNALRLFGLAGKTIILDEVHAYDTYVSSIVERLLSWLSELGTSVILLSATLPAQRRKALIQAYGIQPEDPDQLTGYPCLWVGSAAGQYVDHPPAAQPERLMRLECLSDLDPDPQQQAQWLLSRLEPKGCVCWIVNTVDRAQKLFQAVDRLAPPDVQRLLIHSRYSVQQREVLETWLNALGPSGKRPERAIVIGTQVLEQSLDLDFDWMVTDLAPIDLLLQRAGRLHRHHHRTPEDRGGYPQALLSIYCPMDQAGSLQSDKLGYIYPEYLLLRTAAILQGRSQFVLPEDTRFLIDYVYTHPDPDDPADWQSAWQKFDRSCSTDRGEAENRLLPYPDPRDPCTRPMASLTFEEDEDRAGWIVARTRLGPESMTVIPLEVRDGETYCIGLDQPLRLDQPADTDLQLRLLRHTIKVSGDRLVPALREDIGRRQVIFEQSRLLRNVWPLLLVNRKKDLPGIDTLLELDDRLGLVIHRKKG